MIGIDFARVIHRHDDSTKSYFVRGMELPHLAYSTPSQPYSSSVTSSHFTPVELLEDFDSVIRLAL